MAKQTIYVADFDANERPYIRKLSEMQKKTDAMANRISTSMNKIGLSIAATFGAREIGGFIADSVQLAVKLEGIERAFRKFKESEKILAKLRAATKGTVSDLVLMQSAVKADNFKIPVELLAKGLEFANKRAIQTGESIDYMVDSFITGVARKSIPILDNLGISQIALNKEVEKTGDFYRAISVIVDTENLKMTSSIDAVADRFARLNAQMENSKATIGKWWAPIWGDILGQVAAVINDWTTLFDFTGTARWRQQVLDANKYQAFDPTKIPLVSDSFKRETLTSDADALLISMLRQGKGIKPGKGTGTGSGPVRLNPRGLDVRPNPNFYNVGFGQDANLGGGGANFMAMGGGMNPIQGPEFDAGAFAEMMKKSSDDFLNTFSEVSGIASQIGNIFNITGDSFLGKMISAVDTVSQLLGIANSIMNLASGGGSGILSLFGLKDGGTVVNKGGSLSFTPIPKFARGGSFMVPPGFSNDSGLIRVQSGERVDVTPSNQVPVLGKALSEIKSAILAQTMNMTRGSKGSSQPIIINVDGRAIARATARGTNRVTDAGENLKEL